MKLIILIWNWSQDTGATGATVVFWFCFCDYGHKIRFLDYSTAYPEWEEALVCEVRNERGDDFGRGRWGIYRQNIHRNLLNIS